MSRMISPLLLLVSSLFTSLAASFQTVLMSTSGCGKAPGDTSSPLNITSDGTLRQFLVHVPDSYDKDQATGLILS